MTFLLAHIVDRSAERFPEREAFRFDGGRLRYSELAERSNALARTLVERGVKRGDRVGVYMSNRLESPVAIYAVFKAGAAYVPLDCAAPIERTAGIVRDCGIRHLFVDEPGRGRVDKLRAAGATLDCLIGVDADAELGVPAIGWEEALGPTGESPPAVRVLEADLAYVIFTSGSTGAPKGIMHTHHSGLSYAKLSAATYELRSDDVLTNHSPLHFDMSTFDFFSGPLTGACTVIIPEEYTRVPASLAKLVEDERISIWYSVSSALGQLLAHGALGSRDLGRLRWVLFGGDLLQPRQLRGLQAHMPNARFGNVYGPAETNQCMVYNLPPGPYDSETSIPIGQAWDNTECLVVDEHDRPVAPGEPGELLVRSATMMRGYWNRPDLSSA